MASIDMDGNRFALYYIIVISTLNESKWQTGNFLALLNQLGFIESICESMDNF